TAAAGQSAATPAEGDGRAALVADLPAEAERGVIERESPFQSAGEVLHPGDRGQARRLAAAVPDAPPEPQGLAQEVRSLGGPAQGRVGHPEVGERLGLVFAMTDELPDLQRPAVGIESLLR